MRFSKQYVAIEFQPHSRHAVSSCLMSLRLAHMPLCWDVKWRCIVVCKVCTLFGFCRHSRVRVLICVRTPFTALTTFLVFLYARNSGLKERELCLPVLSVPCSGRKPTRIPFWCHLHKTSLYHITFLNHLTAVYALLLTYSIGIGVGRLNIRHLQCLNYVTFVY